MELKRNFIKGNTDKDSDERLLPEGVARDFLNVRVLSSESGDAGSIETCLGNERVTDLDIGITPVTIATGRSLTLNKIYWLTKSSKGCYFIEYDIYSEEAVIILEDTRPTNEQVLNFDAAFSGFKIIIIEDSDNDKVYACWSDGRNPIRFVNIERAKGYGANNFGQDEISLIKKPPLNMPRISPILIDSPLEENNLAEKFLRFAYRYKYLDGEYSAFSPFSNVVFSAKRFDYNFVSNSNEGMVNVYSGAEVFINTGSHLVTHVEILFKEAGSNTVYKTTAYKKEDEGWGNNEEVGVIYNDKKIHAIVGEGQLKRLYDAVPNTAKTMSYIGGQLMVGNIEENYDLLDSNGERVVVDIELSKETTSPVDGLAGYESVKSIRDYEVGLVYFDEYGRLTSVLTSKGNTIYIPNINSDKKNKLVATIKHKAPAFAKGYRLMIKQSRYEYDMLVCSLFYEDGIYRWVRLLPGERDKIKEGQYLIVKRDTAGIKNTYIEVRVLEIKDQPRNFLENNDYDEDIDAQVAGTYFKIEEKWFRMSLSDFQQYWGESKGAVRIAGVPLFNNHSYFENPIYYGSNTENLLLADGDYTNENKDIRFQIEIDSVDGAGDTFKFSSDNGSSWTSGIAITGDYQPLSDGITIKFSGTTGNLMGDKWILSAKGKYGDGYGSPGNGFGSHLDTRAYAFLQGPVKIHTMTIPIIRDERILAGASIQIFYGEYGSHKKERTVSFVAERDYANIEEWWIESRAEESFDFSFNHYWFRRGFSATVGPDEVTSFTVDKGGAMHWCVRAIGAKSSRHSSIIVTKINVIQSDNAVLLETKSLEKDDDIFYEIGQSYPISSEGYHLSDNVLDTSQSEGADAVINLDWFNCFGWGNGFESYKIKDALNGKGIDIGARAHGTLDEYKKNKRKASITWSGIFEQSINYNALNEFNLSKSNWIDLDPAFGAIQLLHSRDTNLVAFQENRVQPLGYKKTEFFDQKGNPTMLKSDNVLSILNAYAGEYGMSHPESFAVNGNRLYWFDARRGTPLRLSQDGITELSLFNYKSFFKKMAREYPFKMYHAAYDPYFDEYVLSIQVSLNTGKKNIAFIGTIGFSENSKGWTSRYSFSPEGMVGLNNQFFSLKKGMLYKHNSQNVPRNNFYGEQYNSAITLIFNDHPSVDKIFKALNFEGSHPWDVALRTNLTEGTISKDEFENRESRWFAYTRRNEAENDMTALNMMGLGNIISTTGIKAVFAVPFTFLSANDKVYQIVNNEERLIGEIKNMAGSEIEFKNIVNSPVLGAYCYAKKDARSEGGNIRGYFMEVTLTTEETKPVELFSVGANISKSYV